MLAATEARYCPGMSSMREKQRDFLHKAADRTAMTLNQLAESAGVNPATLYKFETGETQRMRRTTINRIARVAKIEPPGLDAAAALETEAAQAPAPFAPAGADEFSIRVLNSSMSAAGIFPGDTLQASRAVKAVQGDIVVAQVYDARLGTADTVVRYFEPPYLVAATDDPQWRKPLHVDGDRVQLVGVVLRQFRVREFRA